MVQSAPQSIQGYMSEFQGWNSALTDILETVPALQWPESNHTYGKMRTDPQLTAVLNAYILPLLAAPKYVDGTGCRGEVVKLIADDLGLPVQGKDTHPGPARRRGVDIDEHMRLAALHLVFGHMPFAERYEIRDGKARLAELSERMPTTITNIITTDDGKLDGILQFGAKNPIPASQLVWYVHEREGASWQGRSMLRSAYGPWLIKHEMWRVLATSNRRFGIGVPQVNAPQGATTEQVRQASLLASSIRGGDQSGAGLPYGFSLDIKGVTGSAPDTLAFIRYLDSQMAQMALASVLNLDASPNGSRALGDTFVNLMMLSLNAVAKDMASVLTRLAVRMVDYNYGEDEPAPRIVIGDVGSRPEVTAEAIVALMNAGAVTADPALEAWVRERWTLPEKEEVPEPDPAPLPPVPVPPEGSEDPTALPPPGQPVAARRFRRSIRASEPTTKRRELTSMEAASGVDVETLDETWTDTVDELIKNWTKISREQRLELAEQIAAAVDDDSIDALAALAVDSSNAADMLAEAMVAMALVSATEMKKEARKQGVSVSGEQIDEERLRETASAVASLMGSGLAGAAGREAIRVWSDGRTGSEVADDVDNHMRSLSDGFLQEQLGHAVSAAQNHGRQAVINAAPKGRYFASEVLDKNTCKACRAIDGEEFESKGEAGQAYASGGYVDCQGRLRCRGIVVAVWND